MGHAYAIRFGQHLPHENFPHFNRRPVGTDLRRRRQWRTRLRPLFRRRHQWRKRWTLRQPSSRARPRSRHMACGRRAPARLRDHLDARPQKTTRQHRAELESQTF